MRTHDIEERGDEVWVSVRVHPKSSKNHIERSNNGSIHVWVTAPPDKGKANSMVIQLMAKQLNIAKRDIAIVAGAKSRTKTLVIKGLGVHRVTDGLSGSN